MTSEAIGKRARIVPGRPPTMPGRPPTTRDAHRGTDALALPGPRVARVAPSAVAQSRDLAWHLRRRRPPAACVRIGAVLDHRGTDALAYRTASRPVAQSAVARSQDLPASDRRINSRLSLDSGDMRSLRSMFAMESQARHLDYFSRSAAGCRSRSGILQSVGGLSRPAGRTIAAGRADDRSRTGGLSAGRRDYFSRSAVTRWPTTAP
jgi:hypothetical protein